MTDTLIGELTKGSGSRVVGDDSWTVTNIVVTVGLWLVSWRINRHPGVSRINPNQAGLKTTTYLRHEARVGSTPRVREKVGKQTCVIKQHVLKQKDKEALA